MAAQRSVYSSYNSSQVPIAYPPRPESSYDDLKHPYDLDIINSYATPDVHAPKQGYPANSPYLGPNNGHSPIYPPMNRKSSFQSSRTGPSDIESSTFDGGGMGSEHALTAPGMEKLETRGIWESLLPDSWACRLYVLTVILETIIDVGVEAELLARVRLIKDDGDLSTERLPVYLSIFAFAHVFQLAMAIDAVHARNTLQFLALTVFNALFLIYAVVQITEIRGSLPVNTANGGISDIPVSVLTTIIPIVISIAEVAYIALGWQIWREFGWKVYKRLGADRRVKRMYAHYQIFVGLMKFDVFFFLGFTLQLIFLVLLKHDWEWYVTIAALPLSFLLLMDGMLAAKYENKYLMWSFMVGCGGAMVYFVYKLCRIFGMRDNIEDVFKTLTVFAIIAIALLLATFVVAVIVLRNFGGGLKYHMTKPKHSAQGSLSFGRAVHQRHQSHPLGVNPNRMSID